jgi:methylated-DNA-[protein]-cysteine S-methyltransferase
MKDLEARLRTTSVADTTALLAAVSDRAAAEGLVDVAWATMDSPIGTLLVAATDAGVVRIGFEGESPEHVLDELAHHISPRVVSVPRRLDAVRTELDEYFAGRRQQFEVAIDTQLSHGFRKLVLEHLVQVPYGRTVSYRDLAVEAGSPGASRAVGSAMATNPIPIVVPCHRVLRTGGGLGGYGGGLPVKEFLLRLEGAIL